MNTMYLIIDKGNKMAKVGFTADLSKRVYAYTTANPKAYIRDYCYTQKRSGTKIERSAHNELASLGGKRLFSVIDGKRTEWFDFEDQPAVFQSLVTNGLRALKTCKGRKTYGIYIK